MKEQSTENNSHNDTIRVIKIVGEESKEEDKSRAKAILSMEGDLVNILSRKLQVFLQDNLLSGGIMDIKADTYEFELILGNKQNTENEHSKTAASYMIDFLDILREDYNLKIDNNFDGLEITSEELERLLDNK